MVGRKGTNSQDTVPPVSRARKEIMKERRYTFGRFLVDFIFMGLIIGYILFASDPVTYRKQEEAYQAFRDTIDYDSIEKAKWEIWQRYKPLKLFVDTL